MENAVHSVGGCGKLPNVCKCNVQNAVETRVKLSIRTNREIQCLGTQMFIKINNVAGMHIQTNRIAEMKLKKVELKSSVDAYSSHDIP